jgi:hypothetical protein
MIDSVTPENPSNPSIFDRIDALPPECSAIELESICCIVAQLKPAAMADAIKALVEKSGYSVSVVKATIKLFKDQNKANSKAAFADALNNIATSASKEFEKQIITPITADGQYNRGGELVLINPTDGEPPYVESIWKENRLSPAAERELRELMKIKATANGWDLLAGGDEEKAIAPTLADLKRDVEIAIQHGKMGQPCRVTFGPWLDKTQGILHTKTDIESKILILKHKQLIKDSPQPKRDLDAWEEGKWQFGDNFIAIIAHCICAITNENPLNKHMLCLYGTAGGGKTTVAGWTARLIEQGTPIAITASGLEGSWPSVFSTRSPIFDNVDNKSFSSENQDTLAAGLTQETVVVRARYTASGLTASLGYPIATSIHESVWGYYEAIKSRSIILRQNFSKEIWERTAGGQGEALISRLRLHVWWLVEQFVGAILANELPLIPGGCRNSSYARARWWVETAILGKSAAEAELICRGLIQQASAGSTDDMHPFVQCWLEAMSFSFGTRTHPREFTSDQIADLMKAHCHADDLDEIYVSKNKKFSEHRKLASHIKYYMEHNLLQGYIKGWKVDVTDDTHRKCLLWTVTPPIAESIDLNPASTPPVSAPGNDDLRGAGSFPYTGHNEKMNIISDGGKNNISPAPAREGTPQPRNLSTEPASASDTAAEYTAEYQSLYSAPRTEVIKTPAQLAREKWENM